jgi:ABC-2 type transport system permease protein
VLPLTVANLRSFIRDRAALFWTIAFPVLFIVIFGTIFSGTGAGQYAIGWVDQDATPASAQLKSAFEGVSVVDLRPTDLEAGLASTRDGSLDALVVVPAGYGVAVGAAQSPSPSAGSLALTLYADPSRTSTASAVGQIVNGITTGVNQSLTGRPPVLTVQTQPVQGEARLSGASYFVPSILAMAIMQLGVFAAIPLVQQREKLILKRIGATPLPRWALVTSNVLVRLVIAVVQTAIILAIGVGAFGVQIIGNWLLIAGIVALGALAFTALGYVIASFARTEEAANGITQVVQMPMLFLSGIFFPLLVMPEWMQAAARVIPLTYLGDALRQVMVGGAPFVPLALCLAVLGVWLVACLAISARFFRWQ